MGLESGTWVSDLVKTNPTSADNVSQGDDHLRLVKTVLQNTFSNANRAFYFPNAATKTADYSVLNTDQNKFFVANPTSGTINFTLPTLGSGDDGWQTYIFAKNLTNGISITPSTGTIDGVSSIPMSIPLQLARVWWDGSSYHVQLDKTTDIVDAIALTSPAKDDSLLIYDLSATQNKKIALSDFFKVIDAFPEIVNDDASTVAVGDEIVLFDVSGTAIAKCTVQHFFDATSTLTEDASPDLANDFVVTYDTSASAAKKAKPKNLVNPLQLVKAWVTWTQSGTTVTVQKSFNVTSVVRNSTGNFTITFTNAMTDQYYVISGMVAVNAAHGSNNVLVSIDKTTLPSTTSFVVDVMDPSSAANQEPQLVSLAIFGN